MCGHLAWPPAPRRASAWDCLEAARPAGASETGPAPVPKGPCSRLCSQNPGNTLSPGDTWPDAGREPAVRAGWEGRRPGLPAVGEARVFIKNTCLARPGVAGTQPRGGQRQEVAGGTEHEAPAQRTGSGSSAPVRIVTEPRIPFWERALDEPPPAVRVEGAAPRGPGRWALPLVARTLNSDTVELSLHAFPTTC